MNSAITKEYILGLFNTLKLTEKDICNLEEEEEKWIRRMELARSKGADDLHSEAKKEAEGIKARLVRLQEEALSLKDEIAATHRQLPGLAARERSIDPDLLEQELLIALGRYDKGSSF